MVDMKKLSPEGEAVDSTDEEVAEAVESLKGIFNGKMKLQFDPRALEDMKRMGITEDELLAALAKDLGVEN